MKESRRDGSADALGQGGKTRAPGRPGLMGVSWEHTAQWSLDPLDLTGRG